MRTGTGLTLLAIGAILAFAVTTNTSVFNLHVAGFVLMLTGLAALLMPRRSRAWLNRRLVQRRTRRSRNGSVVETQETTYPPYVVTSPGIEAREPGLPTSPSLDPDPTVHSVMTPGTHPEQNTEYVEQLRDE
ncbi:MAG: hypothetical protein LBV78_05505 [Kitasatospora sp.]|jgi:uncharacterized protein YjeT (DUF2065 family)|nr:hypothetical protein [Kitasatospora sp.]